MRACWGVAPQDLVQVAKDDIAEIVFRDDKDMIQTSHGHSPYGEPLTRDMVDERYQELSEKDLAEGLDKEVDCA